jgi:hypothetical protein
MSAPVAVTAVPCLLHHHCPCATQLRFRFGQHFQHRRVTKTVPRRQNSHRLDCLTRTAEDIPAERAGSSQSSLPQMGEMLVKSISRTLTVYRSAHALLGLCLALRCAPALADTWTSPLTPTHVQSQDVNGVLTVYISTSQSVINPGSCQDTDEYGTNDAAITNAVLAEALSALTTGSQIQLYISNTQCTGYRPAILGIVLLQ